MTHSLPYSPVRLRQLAVFGHRVVEREQVLPATSTYGLCDPLGIRSSWIRFCQSTLNQDGAIHIYSDLHLATVFEFDASLEGIINEHVASGGLSSEYLVMAATTARKCGVCRAAVISMKSCVYRSSERNHLGGAGRRSRRRSTYLKVWR